MSATTLFASLLDKRLVLIRQRNKIQQERIEGRIPFDVSIACIFFFLFGPGALALCWAQNPNAPTALACGAPAVTDSYLETKTASGDESVGGPLSCDRAREIADAVNQQNGCCYHEFALELIKRAEQRARRACSEKAGNNFACDIYETDSTVCTEGCGILTTPSNDPNGCVTDDSATTCVGTAQAKEIDNGQCVILCKATAQSTAVGDYDVSCSACTAEVNCGGAAEAEIEKRKRISQLEAEKEELEARLAALNPQDPNYAQIAANLMMNIVSIVAELNTLYDFFENIQKLFSIGRVPGNCE